MPKSLESLPKTVSLCRQSVKCGRTHCHCAQGLLHGPYWYMFWREPGGRLRKRYVRQGDAVGLQQRIAKGRAQRQELQRRSAASKEAYKAMASLMKEAERGWAI